MNGNLVELIETLQTLSNGQIETLLQMANSLSNSQNDQDNNSPEDSERSKEEKLDLINQADTDPRDHVIRVGSFGLTERDGLSGLSDNEVDTLVEEIEEKELVAVNQGSSNEDGVL